MNSEQIFKIFLLNIINKYNTLIIVFSIIYFMAFILLSIN